MTPARAELESIVGSLRRKQMLAVMVAALVEMMLAAAVLYAVMRIALPNLALSPSRRLVLVLGLVLVFVAALMLEQARQARSFLYLAKRIDADNDLGDHLVSALSFDDPTAAPFEQACINSLILRLRQQHLRIPDVRLERVWLLIPAVLVAAATGAVEYRRRHRPVDDGGYQVTLPASMRDRLNSITEVTTSNISKADPEMLRQAQDAKRVLSEFIERTASKQDIIGKISQMRDGLATYDQNNPSLTNAAMQLGNPSTQRASELVTAMRTGDGSAVGKALLDILKSMTGEQQPPLSAEERAEIGAVMDELAKISRNQSLSAQLNAAGAAVRNEPTGPHAGQAVAAVREPLMAQFDKEKANSQLRKQILSMIKSARESTERSVPKLQPPAVGVASSDGGTTTAGTTPGKNEQGDSEQPMVSDEETQGTGGNGAGSAIATNNGGGKPESPDTVTREERVSSPWVNASATQIVTASAGSDDKARNEVRQMLGTQERSVEREVRREQIPAEYAQAVRSYFFNVQRNLEKR